MEHSITFVIAGQGIAIIVLLIKAVWGNNTNNVRDLKAALKENSVATHQNTLSITKLMVTMEGVEDKLDVVGELRRDVDRIGEKLRKPRGN